MSVLNSCEYSATCKTCGFSYKRQCLKYCQAVVRDIYNKIAPKSKPSSKAFESVKPLRVGTTVVSSKETAAAVMITTLQSELHKVKTYTYHTAIDAALSEDLPQEVLIYIDAVTEYRDVEKGMQTIESFVERLSEAGKKVLLRAKPSTIKGSYYKA